MKLIVNNLSGFVTCRSNRGIYSMTLDGFCAEFSSGVTVLSGDVDSGGWGVAYALAFTGKDKRILLNEDSEICFGNTRYSVAEFTEKVGYLDVITFQRKLEKRRTVREQIDRNIKKNGSAISVADVQEMFHLSESRLDRPLYQNGNEALRAEAAIEFAAGKEVFCFPWFSARMLCYYAGHLQIICKALSEKGKIVLIPTSYSQPILDWSIICADQKYEFPILNFD